VCSALVTRYFAKQTGKRPLSPHSHVLYNNPGRDRLRVDDAYARMNVPSYMNSQQLAQLRIQPLPCATSRPSPEPAVDSDMVHTPLEDESLDAADFSLSLMGRN
jgi:hypothetical protein